MIGAEEAYQMMSRVPQPGGDQALAQLNQNTQRKLDTSRWLAEENAANERDKWNKVGDAFKTGISQYNRAQDKAYQSERDAVTDKREQARLDSDLARASMENERTKGLMEDERRQRDWELGTEEGHTMSRADEMRNAKLKGELQRPDIEKTNADLNAATVRSTLAMNSTQMKQMEETNRTAKEDRAIARAANLYSQALRANDQRKVAEIDAEFSKDLSPQSIQLAKNKAMSDMSTAQTMKDMEVRGTQVGGQAINEIASANADATQLSQVVNDAMDYIKATPGSAEADVAKQKVLASLNDKDREYVSKGSGIGLAGYTVDTSGASRPQDRMVQTLHKIRSDLERKVNMLENQYGQLPSNEVKQGIMNLKQSIQKIDMGLSGQTRNSIQLIGGGRGGPSNADFFTPRQAAPAPNPAGRALGTIPVGGMPPMQPTPSMRGSQINQNVPAAGAAR